MRRLITTLLINFAVLMPLLARPGLANTPKTMSTKIASTLLPNRSPLVTFRIIFMTGAASDPAGKEGVAALTAAMIA